MAALAQAMAGKGPDDLIFPDPRTGQAWTHSAFSKAYWYPAKARAAAAGLTSAPRFHDLRHTHAAWLLSAGVPLLVVSQRLGHDSVAITADLWSPRPLHRRPSAGGAGMTNCPRCASYACAGHTPPRSCEHGEAEVSWRLASDDHRFCQPDTGCDWADTTRSLVLALGYPVAQLTGRWRWWS